MAELEFLEPGGWRNKESALKSIPEETMAEFSASRPGKCFDITCSKSLTEDPP
jgi:hypothetical protein